MASSPPPVLRTAPGTQAVRHDAGGHGDQRATPRRTTGGSDHHLGGIGRHERQWAASQRGAGRAGQRQPELRAVVAASPRPQASRRAAGRPRGRWTAETGATGRAGTRWVGAPEPVEDHARPRPAQPDAVVPDGDGDGHARRRSTVTSTAVPSPCSIALATRLRTIRSTRRGSTSATTTRPVGGTKTHSGAALVGERPRRRRRRAARRRRGRRRSSSSASRAGVEAADLEQVGQQPLEPVELRAAAARRTRARRASKSSRAS